MGVTLRSFILSFILIVAAAFVYQLSSRQSGPSDEEILQTYPSFSAENFAGDNFDKGGRLIHHFEAGHVTYYKSRALITMQEPTGIYYSYPGGGSRAEPWALSATSGSFVLDKEAELIGEVEMHPLFEGSPVTSAVTSYLHFDLQQNLITTPEIIRISGPNFVNYGSGLEADLNEKLIKVGNPHARYEFN
ncbi:MAG: LPS export ABC transporter periplasmic protein LptC [Proteobacteria bacterium]|uniref:LPS export ABC transporter periplasmic protein LptC n=1 Tax=Candidatus Avisuccinivibrio stercorigallinarum TaxID=2840704 RepID=A0A9D9DAW4_9GAMM|nr:LPS export ABC transporter periplasmic protein LptC [Candidatus Avisuccinivibrio stercorigallinarum]